MRSSRVLSLVALPLLIALPHREARAQQESAASAMNPNAQPLPPPPPAPGEGEEIVVVGDRRSPSWSQARTFPGVRFWRLDKGQQLFEFWYTGRFKHDGVSGDTTHLWQVEYEVSLIKGFQFDAYFNYKHDKEEGYHVEGAQLEARIAPWNYGEIWGNPALYLEWHPQNRGPNRGEVRLLVGGELGTPRLRGAINPFYEQNLDSPTGRSADFEREVEMGVTGALGYAPVPGVSVGAEGRYSAEQQGKDENNPHAYQNVVKVGPAVWFSFLDGSLRLTASGTFGLTKDSDAFATTVVLGVRP